MRVVIVKRVVSMATVRPRRASPVKSTVVASIGMLNAGYVEVSFSTLLNPVKSYQMTSMSSR